MGYRIEVTAVCRRDLDRLPQKVYAAVIETMRGSLSDIPHRVGKPLRDELAGFWACRRGEYRIVYEIDDGRRVVTVHRAQHRRDIYRPR